jgi:hypothetical protein
LNETQSKQKQNMKTETKNLEKGILSLRTLRRTQWSVFYARLESVAKTTSSGEDLSDATASDFVAVGFNQDEADALIFIACDAFAANCSQVENWLFMN